MEVGHTSVSPFTCLTFADDESADVGYALLCSRLTYWLWRVEGDGFHVAKSFLSSLPYSPRGLAPDVATNLGALGRVLWERVKDSATVAVNKQRATASFPAMGEPELLDEVDDLIQKALQLPAIDLRGWYEHSVLLDGAGLQRGKRLRGVRR
jgi:hypothetical protein